MHTNSPFGEHNHPRPETVPKRAKKSQRVSTPAVAGLPSSLQQKGKTKDRHARIHSKYPNRGK